MPEPATAAVSDAAISFRDIFAYHLDEARRWREWLAKQPDTILDIAVGEPPIAQVRDLLHHIFLVEWIYVQALTNQPFDRWNTFKSDSLASIFLCADETEAGLRNIVDSATAANLEEEAVLPAPSRTLKGSRRKFLIHIFVHSTRHWAQLASALRAGGYTTDWQHDLVMSDVLK
jgi:uncharacterized damage-inducible protein DinB